jgi:predicted ATPase
MAYPHAYIYSFSSKGIERVVCEKTEHYYRVTRDFLSNPQRMLKVLLAP